MKEFAVPAIDWATLMPVLVVMGTGVVALIIEMVIPRRNNNVVVAVSLVGLAVAAYTALPLLHMVRGSTAGSMAFRDHFGTVLELLLILICAISFLFSERYLREKGIAFAEFYPLALWSTAGGMLMVSTFNLLMMFLGLEVLSIALYCLAGMSRKEQKSEESALKYFLLGAFASAFFLYGVALVYGASGTLNLNAISIAVFTTFHEYMGLAALGVLMMIVGLGFKTALVPFHQWTPDVYQGAPTNVTAFMAAASKVAAFGALARILMMSTEIEVYWFPILYWIAIATMVVGNLFAIAQRDVKRILAYSSIAHAGYVLVALLSFLRTGGRIGIETVVFYLFAYSITTIGAFAVVTLAANKGKEQTRLQDLNGLWQKSPFAAGTLALFMVSLVGIPPTAGFFGKYMIFTSAVDAGLQPLAYVLAITSAVSLYYYLAIFVASLVEDKGVTPTETAKASPGLTIACFVCAVGVLGSMVFARPILDFIQPPTQSRPTVRVAEPPPQVEQQAGQTEPTDGDVSDGTQ